MATIPKLLYVAGPNGAGKSTFSKLLSEPGAIIFDVDLVIARIEAQSPGLNKKQVYQAATDEFFNLAEKAAKTKQHFTLETNFRDEDLLAIVSEFKRLGFNTNMIYLTLENIDYSIDRVHQRVENGGHYVDEQNIRQNFDLGLEFLQRFADRFDNLEVIDASKPGFELRSLLRIQNGDLQHVYDLVPGKVAETLRAIVQQFTPPSLGHGDKIKRYRGPRH